MKGKNTEISANDIKMAPVAIVIAEGLQEFNIETDLTAAELFDMAAHTFSTALYQSVKAGVAFLAAQVAVNNSEVQPSREQLRQSESTFKSWIKSRGLTEQRVYESIRLAKGYLAIPSEQRKSYLALGKYKAIKLASIEPEAIAELAGKNPDVLDEMALLSREELVKKINNLHANLEIEQSKNKRMVEANTIKRLTSFTPRTEEIRAECLALQLESDLPINSLQKLFYEANENDPDSPEWRLQIEQIWITAHAVAARALDMLQTIKETVRAGDMPERVQGEHILTPEEAERWLLDAPMIANRHEAEKALRKDKRADQKPKGPGRPKGSGKKAEA